MMIDGVRVKTLKIIPDDRGRLMEILRCDEEAFKKFGQVYMTTVFKDVVKAWHFHKIQTDNFACIRGKIRLGLYDARKDSPTYAKAQEIVMGIDTPLLVTIPNLVYHGFKGMSDEESVIINTPTEPYNRAHPDEYRLDPFDNDIPFDWRK